MPLKSRPTVKMDAPRLFHQWVIGLRDEMAEDKDRVVTIAETLQHIREVYEAAKAGTP